MPPSYNEEVFFPLINDMGERLEEAVKIRAQLRGQDAKQAGVHLHRNLDVLLTHLKK